MASSSSFLFFCGLHSNKCTAQISLRRFCSTRRHLPHCRTLGFRGNCILKSEHGGTAAIRTSNEVDVSENRYSDDDDFVVVNFYKFVRIDDPEEEGRDIHGRIYLNEEGINAQYSGPRKDAVAYIEWLKQDYRFCDVLVQISPAVNGHAFPRLKLRYKPSLVQQLQIEEGTSKLPLLDQSLRATPLLPSEWRSKLEQMNDASNNHCILLDVRNGYEWDVGHFRGAERPDVDCFRSTSFGQIEKHVVVAACDPLSNADKERTDILMYCTGGIRCDVYSTVLRRRGFKRLYTLKGGISHYLNTEGPVGWVGNLFVFDARLSLPPSTCSSSSQRNSSYDDDDNNRFGKCYVCRRRNIALGRFEAEINDLNARCCSDCVEDLRGCCCGQCTTAKRLRPVLRGQERYRKWHTYRESNYRNCNAGR
ncbi:hypothetical protein M569_08392 [Genlisea aurea]|uniref:Rhodanese domain-containing protein n=1 Tax=Genlisea aurea TaxID=192259 RepID=S8CI69_9LAMI|nr:hypothetical protein M569_08392 [Genlisea aurea]